MYTYIFKSGGKLEFVFKTDGKLEYDNFSKKYRFKEGFIIRSLPVHKTEYFNAMVRPWVSACALVEEPNDILKGIL